MVKYHIESSLKMKVLHFIDSQGLYGAEKILISLMQAQKDIGIEPVLVSIGDVNVGSKDIEIEAQRQGLDTFPLRFRNGLNLKGSMMILKCAKNIGAHIIHNHGYKGDILLGIVPRKFRKIPILATLHGWTSTTCLSKIWVYEWMDACFIKNLDKVVVVSSGMLQDTRLAWLRTKAEVINNGIPVHNFKEMTFVEEFSELASSLQGKLKIVSIGRLSFEKGLDVLIRALARIVSSGVDASLILFGDGREKESLKELAEEESVTSRVSFIGYHEKAFRFLPFFDVFVLPSYTEGLPVTLLEAMQACVPIIATNVGEVPQVLDGGRCGRLVAPGNADELAKAIEEINRNKQESKTKAILARERALKEYGVEKMAQRYADLYQDLILGRSEASKTNKFC